jgi:hypothetical protein
VRMPPSLASFAFHTKSQLLHVGTAVLRKVEPSTSCISYMLHNLA